MSSDSGSQSWVLDTQNRKQNLMKQNKNKNVTKRQTKPHAPLTYCGVSDEGLSVGHHGVHSHLLVILTRDDRYGGLPAVPVSSPDQSEPFIMSADQSEADVLTWESA